MRYEMNLERSLRIDDPEEFIYFLLREILAALIQFRGEFSHPEDFRSPP